MLVIDYHSCGTVCLRVFVPLAIAAIQLALPQAEARNHSHTHVESFVVYAVGIVGKGDGEGDVVGGDMGTPVVE